jgi:tetratricopeptide (TPR) repeat protein
LTHIGLTHKAKGDKDEALKHLVEALKIHQETGSKKGEANALANIGLIYWSGGDLDLALKTLNESLGLFEDLGMREQVQKTEENIELLSEMKAELEEQ